MPGVKSGEMMNFDKGFMMGSAVYIGLSCQEQLSTMIFLGLGWVALIKSQGEDLECNTDQ